MIERDLREHRLISLKFKKRFSEAETNPNCAAFGTDRREGDCISVRIGFIGAGKVGFSLGRYLTEHDMRVSGYYSRSYEAAREAAVFTKTKCYETLEALVMSSDALFLTVPDGAIGEVWNSVKAFDIADKCICHCSGALSSAVFSEISQTGAFGYSIHPLLAVSDRLQSYRDFSKAYIIIEGHEAHLSGWQHYFARLGNPVKLLDAEQKTRYHCAAVFASNFVVGLFETSSELLRQCGFTEAEASAALTPLFLNNAGKIASAGAVEALTGPVERADTQTVERHLCVLDGNRRALYCGLSRELAALAQRKHPERDYEELTRVLEEADSGKEWERK